MKYDLGIGNLLHPSRRKTPARLFATPVSHISGLKGTSNRAFAYADSSLLLFLSLSTTTRRGSSFFKITSWVTTHFVTSLREGKSYITFCRISSTIALKPRAPVLRRIA